MSAADFLRLPEEKPYLAYVDGRVEQKPTVNAAHRRIVRRLDSLFDRYIEQHGGDAGPEGRVQLETSGNYQLPDTAYWQAGAVSGDDSIPTVAVEVRSPGQSVAKLRAKCVSFLADGTRECWLIDPEARTLERITSQSRETLKAGDTLAPDAMPGFSLRLSDLFAVLDQ
jgi:Uma2 family endonuclease